MWRRFRIPVLRYKDQDLFGPEREPLQPRLWRHRFNHEFTRTHIIKHI